MAQSGPDSETDDTFRSRVDDDQSDTDATDATDAADPTDDTETEESEWQFGLDEVGPDGIVEAEPEPLEPGRPSVENVFFILLGIALTVFLLSTVV